MSLFRKKKWDIERSEQNKGLIRQLFSQAMPDGDTWKIVYGYGLNIKTSDYIIARKTTYTYTSLIIGYRESDMSIIYQPEEHEDFAKFYKRFSGK